MRRSLQRLQCDPDWSGLNVPLHVVVSVTIISGITSEVSNLSLIQVSLANM